MKVGTITTPNQKGQIVIPKKIREQLNINDTTHLYITIVDNIIHIRPVTETAIQHQHNREAILKMLKETQGAWAGDDWEKTEKERRKVELEAAKKRKNAW